MRNEKRLFQHKVNGKFYRLLKTTQEEVNTYLEVDINNDPVIDWRSFSVRPCEQKAIITGFNNLTEI
tara:strand:- start:81 stop:281 length:201 start_codon:yes stop_codon:yes gene_type:complete